MKVCFIGHRKIEITEELESSLFFTVQTLINNGATTFVFGSKSEFNDLSLKVVTKLKEKYPYIKRVYVRAEYQHVDKFYEKYLLKSYEETYFPSQINNAGKSSYVKRNYEMIDISNFCIFYYNENYTAPARQKTNSSIFSQQVKRQSGTKIAYQYAFKKKKQIINLYK